MERRYTNGFPAYPGLCSCYRSLQESSPERYNPPVFRALPLATPVNLSLIPFMLTTLREWVYSLEERYTTPPNVQKESQRI